MYRPSAQSRLEAYQYNPQPAEDHEDDHVREKKTRTDGLGNRATYRPTPLTWPFISALIVLIAAAIALVIFVRQTKPNSDNDAHIQSRDLDLNPAGSLYQPPRRALLRRDISSSTITSPGADSSSPSATPELSPALSSTPNTAPTTTFLNTLSPSGTTTVPISEEGARHTNPPVTSSVSYVQLVASTTVITSCDPLSCVLEEIIVSYYKTEYSVVTSVPSTFETVVPPSEYSPYLSAVPVTTVHTLRGGTSTFKSTVGASEEGNPITYTSSDPISTMTIYPTITVPYGNSSAASSESTIYSETTVVETPTETYGGSVIDVTTTILSEYTDIQYTTVTIYPVGTQQPSTGVGTEFVPSTAVYIDTGSTTLYQTKTIPNPNRNVPVDVVSATTVEIPDQVVTNEVTVDGKTVVTHGPDEVVTQYVIPEPTTIVSEVEGSMAVVAVATTIPAGTAITQIVETQVGGQLTTLVQQQQPQTIVSTVGGVAQTVVTIPPIQTMTSLVGGTVVSVPTGTSVNAAGQTITLFAESTVGGSLTTFVTQPPPETLVQTVDGVVTTIITTPDAQTLTTMIGGSLTTMTIVSTPTGAVVSTYTTSSSVSGHLTTVINTPSPTSIVTTISGKLTTMVSTPSITTMVSTISGTSYTSTFTSTSTLASPSGDSIVVTAKTVAGFTAAEYFVGKFLPALYSIALAIILRIIDINAKLYQPFHALSDPAGAFGQDSLNLQYSGLLGFVTPIITLVQGHPIPFITTFSVLLSSFLVPLSSEAIGIKLVGTCQKTAIENCAGRLGVSPAIAIILVAVLASIIVLLLLLLFFLRKYNTGLHSNPWSIAGMASLATNPDIRIHGADGAAIKASLAEKRFGLGTFENSHGRDDYGIVLVDESGRQLTDGAGRDDQSDYWTPDAGGETDPVTGNKKHNLPFMALSWPWRFWFIVVLLTMFGLTLYYHLTATKSNLFRNWIQGQTFGVRFLFAGVGVIVAMCFFSFFTSVAIISPYTNMHHRSQPPEKSILLTRPTNAFFGIYTAIKRRDVFFIAVAFMAIMTEFLPIILINVPYSLTQTRMTHIVCTRLTMAILMGDVLVVSASLFRKWPHMPADPRNVAGAMYYVIESKMMTDFEGTSEMKRKERDNWLREKGRRYFYSETPGNAGGYRMAVDGDAVTGEGGLDRVKTEYRGYEGS